MNPPGRRQEDDINIVAALTSHGVGTCGADHNQGQAGHLIPVHETGQGWWKEEDLAGTLRAEGEGRPSRPSHLIPTLGVAYAHSLAVRGREDGQEWELGDPEVGNALRAGDGGSSRANWALTPEMAVRRLLPIECERLQGFPDNWTAGRSDSARYRMLGNAVCVPIAEWIGRQIVEARL